MTQEEVDLIYDYLHEKYKYRHDGNLIKKSKDKRTKNEIKLGSFVATEKNPKITCTLIINKKTYCKPLSHLIYLYFNKLFPEVIFFKDGNPTNTKIENMKSVSNYIAKQNNPSKKYTSHKNNNNKDYFRSFLCVLKKFYSLGWYDSKEKAIVITEYAKKLIIQGYTDIEKIKEEIKLIHPWSTFKIKKNRKCPPGVHKRKDKFRATIRINGKKKLLGTFNSADEAHQAYLKAKMELNKS